MTPDRLREIYGQPSKRASKKVIREFDQHCRQFIAHSPFVFIATSNGTDMDVSPRGDSPGFVQVEDNRTLLIPDRPGNNRLDSLINILANPNTALIFMIPNVTETLRVNGTAEIIEDSRVCNRFTVYDRAPKTVLKINAEQIFTHCGKAPLRAGLWKPDTWSQSRPIPTLNQMIKDHANVDVESIDQSYIDERYNKTLY